MFPLPIPARNSVTARIRWRLLSSFLDLVAFVASVLFAFELRFDGAVPDKFLHAAWVALIIWPATKTMTFIIGGVNRCSWKDTSIFDAQRIALANLAGSFLGGLAIIGMLGPWGIPRSIYLLEWIVASFLILGSRLAILVIVSTRKTRWAQGEGTKTLIYGAGIAGLQLLRELLENRSLKTDVVGFIDDDPSKTGLVLGGKRVLGTGRAIKSLTKNLAVKRLLIAIPSATGPQLVRILNIAADADIEYKMVPSLGDLVQGKELGGQIRNIAVEDLLGRQSVQLDQSYISELVHGRVVMVTGAAGSIGSELCRQIARFHPKGLIGLDVAETPLFQLERELCGTFPDLIFHAEIGSITSSEDLQFVMARYRPSILYHAAAYKHVPLMERHVFAAVENNIFGTWQTAMAAIRNGVEDFVLISSDKAVRPTSVMGATKRIAELVIRSLESQGKTKCVSVRFGNVLGSNGSVVPIFKEQIAAGGPVTVTHPEMRRYFMTIPEAAQLVLQASSFGKGGDVFLLDMGDPVKIADLARDLILLSGLKPGKDIRIEFSGLRPGEKLFEELNLQNECLRPTLHKKIRRYASPSNIEIDTLQAQLQELREIVYRRDVSRLVQLFSEVVPDYTPGSLLLETASLQNKLVVEEEAGPLTQVAIYQARHRNRASLNFTPASENG